MVPVTMNCPKVMRGLVRGVSSGLISPKFFRIGECGLEGDPGSWSGRRMAPFLERVLDRLVSRSMSESLASGWMD